MTNSPKDAADIAARLHRLTGLTNNQIDTLSLSLDPLQVDAISDSLLASLASGTLPGLPTNPDGGLPLGLPGATAAARWVGATVSGPPSTGSFLVGDWVLDQTGAFYVCTVAGSPGTWVQATGGGGGSYTLPDATSSIKGGVRLTGDLGGTATSPTVPGLAAKVNAAGAAAAAPVQSVASRTGAVTLTKADVGLGNVDNTSDVNKPVSTAQAAAFLPAVRIAAAGFAATVTPNSATTDVLNVGVLTGNLTLANPTGSPTDGQTLRVRLVQDGTGSRTVSFGTGYAFGTDITTSLIPSAASSKWEMLFAWHAGDSKWRALSIVRGF